MNDDPCKYLTRALGKVQPGRADRRRLFSGSKESLFGLSVEFAQHREYVLGDDTSISIERVARAFFFAVRRGNGPRCWILLDAANRWPWLHRRNVKVRLCLYVGRALAYLVLHQSDAPWPPPDPQIRSFLVVEPDVAAQGDGTS